MCTPRESGQVRAGLNAVCQMDHGGRREKLRPSILRREGIRQLPGISWLTSRRISLSARILP